MRTIRILIGEQEYLAELNESDTARKVWGVLPIDSQVSVWGDEVYFSIPITMSEAPDACEEVAVGALAFWPPGNAFCVFFGPTPVSKNGVPRAYSPVNVFGKISGDLQGLKSVRNGAPVRVEIA